MADDVQYFAIVSAGRAQENPGGIARRTNTPDGKLDEAFHRDLTWQPTTAIRQWERAEGTPVVEITAEEAERIVESFKERWRDLPEG